MIALHKNWASIQESMDLAWLRSQAPQHFKCWRCKSNTEKPVRCFECGSDVTWCRECSDEFHELAVLHNPHQWEVSARYVLLSLSSFTHFMRLRDGPLTCVTIWTAQLLVYSYFIEFSIYTCVFYCCGTISKVWLWYNPWILPSSRCYCNWTYGLVFKLSSCLLTRCPANQILNSVSL